MSKRLQNITKRIRANENREDCVCLLNQKVKNYELVKVLGSGLSAGVFKAKDDNHEFYGLKLFFLENKYASKTNQTEINIYSKLKKGTNITYKVDYFEDTSLRDTKSGILILPYMTTSLANIDFDIETEETVYDIIKQIINGLDELHSQNIAHRDLFPGNVLVNLNKSGKTKYNVRITDFGISSYKEKNRKDDILIDYNAFFDNCLRFIIKKNSELYFFMSEIRIKIGKYVGNDLFKILLEETEKYTLHITNVLKYDKKLIHYKNMEIPTIYQGKSSDYWYVKEGGIVYRLEKNYKVPESFEYNIFSAKNNYFHVKTVTYSDIYDDEDEEDEEIKKYLTDNSYTINGDEDDKNIIMISKNRKDIRLEDINIGMEGKHILYGEELHNELSDNEFTVCVFKGFECIDDIYVDEKNYSNFCGILLDALVDIHSKGRVHGNISSSVVFYNFNDGIKIGCFTDGYNYSLNSETFHEKCKKDMLDTLNLLIEITDGVTTHIRELIEKVENNKIKSSWILKEVYQKFINKQTRKRKKNEPLKKEKIARIEKDEDDGFYMERHTSEDDFVIEKVKHSEGKLKVLDKINDFDMIKREGERVLFQKSCNDWVLSRVLKIQNVKINEKIERLIILMSSNELQNGKMKKKEELYIVKKNCYNNIIYVDKKDRYKWLTDKYPEVKKAFNIE